jgi:hypothetical protein
VAVCRMLNRADWHGISASGVSDGGRIGLLDVFCAAAVRGCRAESNATQIGLWMSSSQSLTTPDMRGFHSLWTVVASVAAVVCRWIVERLFDEIGDRSAVRATWPPCSVALLLGQRRGADRGVYAWAIGSTGIDMGNRESSGGRRGRQADGSFHAECFLRRVWTIG